MMKHSKVSEFSLCMDVFDAPPALPCSKVPLLSCPKPFPSLVELSADAKHIWEAEARCKTDNHVIE